MNVPATRRFQFAGYRNETVGRDFATLVAAGIGLAGTSGSFAAPVNGTTIGTAAANATIIDQVQRCRCVERRWNGSCKLRICRNSW